MQEEFSVMMAIIPLEMDVMLIVTLKQGTLVVVGPFFHPMSVLKFVVMDLIMECGNAMMETLSMGMGVVVLAL